MDIRIAADAHVETIIGQRGDQFDRIGETIGVRHKAVRALGRIAPQCHDVLDPRFAEATCDLQRLFPAGVNAGQMPGNPQPELLTKGADRFPRQFTCRAARAIGHRYPFRGQRSEC